MLPAGTEVKDVRLGRDVIRFTAAKSGVAYAILHVRKHSKITVQQLRDRLLSTEDVMAKGGSFEKLTKAEQDNVKAGTIAVGMSREAVLMAYGYPPSHKTPDLKSNVWMYWRDRFRRTAATFDAGGKVTELR